MPAKPPEKLGSVMSCSKSLATFLTVGLCTFALSADAFAQGRGGGGGRGGSGGGGRAPAAGRPAPQGGAAPRTAAPPNGRYNGARGGAPNGNYYANGRYYGNGRYYANGRYPYYGYGRYPYYGYGRYPYYGYRYPYYGYGYGYYPGFSIGFSWGYPYFGYPYYSYPYYAPYAGYGYVGSVGAAYGSIKIQGAPRNAEVYVDGGFAGVVDSYDGAFQSLDLEPGSHVVEVRVGGRPLTYDVNVTAGHTVTIHATVR